MLSSFIGLAIFALIFTLLRTISKRENFFIFSLLSLMFCLHLYAFRDLSYVIPTLTSFPFIMLLIFVTFEYLILRFLSSSKWFYWGYLFPLIFLIVFKGLAVDDFIGLSYLSFRMILLLTEMKSDEVEMPGFFAYITFCCFPLTFQMGPINSYSNFIQTWVNKKGLTFNREILQKFGFGLFKFFLISNVLNTIIVSNFSAIKETNSILFLLIYCSLTYLWIYTNFSGFSDIVIGIAQFSNFKIKENFDNPLMAVDIQSFWSKWHLSLTDLVREVVFMPLLIWSKRKYPTLNHSVLVSLFFIFFIIIGLWHGFGAEYFLLGIYHALGMTIFYIYKNVLGDKLNKLYSNRLYKFISWGFTFTFVSISFIFFRFSMTQIYDLVKNIAAF